MSSFCVFSSLLISLSFLISLLNLFGMVTVWSLLLLEHFPWMVLLNLALGEIASGLIFRGGDEDRDACLLKLYASNCSLQVGDILIQMLSTLISRCQRKFLFRDLNQI